MAEREKTKKTLEQQLAANLFGFERKRWIVVIVVSQRTTSRLYASGSCRPSSKGERTLFGEWSNIRHHLVESRLAEQNSHLHTILKTGSHDSLRITSLLFDWKVPQKKNNYTNTYTHTYIHTTSSKGTHNWITPILAAAVIIRICNSNKHEYRKWK